MQITADEIGSSRHRERLIAFDPLKSRRLRQERECREEGCQYHGKEPCVLPHLAEAETILAALGCNEQALLPGENVPRVR